jgi:phenylacetic acid degradation operon negative regulatory protein
MTVVSNTAGTDPTTLSTRLLVLGMAHRDGKVLAEEVYPVAEVCGQTPDQVRSCLRRLVTEGLFTREGEGRSAVFRSTEAGRRALASTLRRHRLAYAQDAAGKGWDRRWRLVAFAVPEQQRAARDAFRDRLLALGGASVQGGLYVSPHDWLDDVTEAAKDLGMAQQITTATTDDLVTGGESDPRVLARRLWNLDDLARRYQSFTDRYQGVPAALEAMRQRHERLTDAEFLAGALVTAVDFQACFNRDPLLPPELLPRPWPGRAARELLARARRLGALTREHGGPALFAYLDDTIEALP